MQNLDEVYKTACENLADAVKNRHNDFRTMNIASTGLEGNPQMRTLVLRKFDEVRRTIIFHTDIRSQKVQEIRVNPNIMVHGYSKELKTQLRFKAFAHIHHQDDLAAARWESTQDQAKKCYAGEFAEGTILDEAGDGLGDLQKNTRQITEEEKNFAWQNFAVIVCNYSELDYLYLRAAGHIRARFEWDEGGEKTGNWIVP